VILGHAALKHRQGPGLSLRSSHHGALMAAGQSTALGPPRRTGSVQDLCVAGHHRWVPSWCVAPVRSAGR
jgi:hypothetical protein